ncbi:MAG: serine/threonine protein kinase [Fuerstia sp.]|nr:serine/threonine protein kinase [Fuerstiella sp.]
MSENQNLIGGYELKNCVATGKSTQIWEVTQAGSTVPLAMKLLLPDSLKDPVAKSVLKHEFKVGALFEHPSMIRYHKIEVNRDHGFFIMDYFRAPSLKTQITGNLAETQSRLKKIVEALCQAFVHMNEKGWLHRDIKPDNVLVNKTGEVRVIDFSLATRIMTGVMKLVGGKQKNIMGTRTYIAPEIILKKSPTPQSDIYSLGITIYELATGAPPFAGLNPSDLLAKHLSESPSPPSVMNPNITPELDALILKLISKKPKDRPVEMREVMSLFRNVRCFVEDPAELYARKMKDAKANESLSVDKRLDSRADADRVSRGLEAPVKPKKSKRMTAPIGEMEAVKKAGAKPAASQPQQVPVMMPQMPYGMPGQPMPGMMYPGMMPGQPMPGMMHPGMMPGQMMPGMQPYPMQMPGQPMQMMPGQMPMQPPMPQQQQQPMPPQQQPVPQQPVRQPVPPQPVQPQQQVTPPRAAAPAPQVLPAQDPAAAPVSKTVLLPLDRRMPTSAAEDPALDPNLEFMTELPDVL